MSHYERLGIPMDADDASIKRAYFAQVKQHSPDQDPQGFKAVREAYDTLRDPAKRQKYDVLVQDSQAELMLQAEALIHDNDYLAAITLLARVVNEHPEHLKSQYLLAVCHFYMGKTGKAATVLKQLLAVDETYTSAWLLHVQISASRGHCVKAEEYFDTALHHVQKQSEHIQREVWIVGMKVLSTVDPWIYEPKLRELVSTAAHLFEDEYRYYLSFIRWYMITRSPYQRQLLSESLVSDFEGLIRWFLACHEKKPITAQSLPEEIFETVASLQTTDVDEALRMQLLQVALASPWCRDETRQALSQLVSWHGLATLREDKRMHPAVLDFVSVLLGFSDNRWTQKELEGILVYEATEIRSSLKVLKKEYPHHFEKQAGFFNQLLSLHKLPALEQKYRKTMEQVVLKSQKFIREEQTQGLFQADDEVDDESLMEMLWESLEDDGPEVAPSPVRRPPKIERNDPCPCGSGKKYKKCCA